MKENYPFINFAFNLIFEVQAEMKTHSKNKSPIASKQMRNCEIWTLLDAMLLKIKFQLYKVQ